MRKLTNALSLIATCLLLSSCSKNESNNLEKINSATCYKGVIVARDCPSFAYVQIEKNAIGERWVSNGKTYLNVVGIANLPTGIYTDTIYFSINTKKDFSECVPQTPCMHLNPPLVPTSKIYCASFISTSNCQTAKN